MSLGLCGIHVCCSLSGPFSDKFVMITSIIVFMDTYSVQIITR